MNTKETLPLTRKAAVLRVVALLEKEGKCEEIRVLKELAAGMPVLHWTKEAAADCVDNFLLENGRLPTVTELAKNKELPCHTDFKYLFGVSARKWLEEYYAARVFPKTSRKRALLAALRLSDGEEKERIADMLSEYPVAPWNEKNITDCIVTYYEKYRRVPEENDMKHSAELPYGGVFKYRWKTTYLKWLEERLPVLYNLYCSERAYRRDYAAEFICEYNRIRPKSETDFNARRNRAVCCGAGRIKSALNVTRWADLLKACGLRAYDGAVGREEAERNKIKSVRIIAVDCGENIFFKEYGREEERQLASAKT